MKTENKTLASAFSHFFDIVKAVRNGCPWDKDQTPLSLRSTFFEETCEAIDALTQEDPAHVKEELGDVLLNVVLIAYLFEEKGLFTVEEVIDGIAEKLVRRHPHVFAESAGKSEISGSESKQTSRGAKPTRFSTQFPSSSRRCSRRTKCSKKCQKPASTGRRSPKCA